VSDQAAARFSLWLLGVVFICFEGFLIGITYSARHTWVGLAYGLCAAGFLAELAYLVHYLRQPDESEAAGAEHDAR
jgi:hypothetical protein